MFRVKINGRVVGQTPLEDVSAAAGVRFGAAHLAPEYEEFRELIQEYTLVTCVRDPVPRRDGEEVKAAYRNLTIELVSDSGATIARERIEISDLRRLSEGAPVIVSVPSRSI